MEVYLEEKTFMNCQRGSRCFGLLALLHGGLMQEESTLREQASRLRP